MVILSPFFDQLSQMAETGGSRAPQACPEEPREAIFEALSLSRSEPFVKNPILEGLILVQK